MSEWKIRSRKNIVNGRTTGGERAWSVVYVCTLGRLSISVRLGPRADLNCHYHTNSAARHRGRAKPSPFFFETKERRDHLLGWREASKGWRKERERNRERQRRDRENKVEGGGRRWGYSIFRPYQYGTRGRGLVSRGPRRWTREPWPRPLAPYQQGEMPSNRRENVGSAGKSKWRMASSGAPFVSRRRRPPMTG